MPRFLLVIALCFVSGQLFADSYYVYSMLTGEGEVFGAKVQLFPRWKQTTQFSNDEDWMFASPVQLGRLPWSYPRVLNAFYDAGTAAEIGRLSAHTMRHTYRSWLDALGAPLPCSRNSCGTLRSLQHWMSTATWSQTRCQKWAA